jgi:hypothetical protein
MTQVKARTAAFARVESDVWVRGTGGPLSRGPNPTGIDGVRRMTHVRMAPNLIDAIRKMVTSHEIKRESEPHETHLGES